MEHRWNETQGKTEVLGGKTCLSATLFTTNPIWTDPGSNPSLRGGMPATNRLSHGTAYINLLSVDFFHLFNILTTPNRQRSFSFKKNNVGWVKSHKSHNSRVEIKCVWNDK
jgi:hypothetical protein